MSDTSPEADLPTDTDKSNWTPRDKMAHTWLINDVATVHFRDQLDELEISDEDKMKIQSAASVGRIMFMSFISEITGYELTNEEWAKVIVELGRARQELQELDSSST